MSENRASVAPPPSRHCHAFRFRQFLKMRFRARRAVSRSGEARGDGRVTVIGLKKMKIKKMILGIEAAALASVRPSAVLKNGSPAKEVL